MARNYAALPYEYLEEMEELDDAEFGRLCRALLKYSRDGTRIEAAGNERFFAKRVMYREDGFRDSYEEIADRNRTNGQKGGRPRKNPEKPRITQNNPEKPKITQNNPEKPRITQKTQDEVKVKVKDEVEDNNIIPPYIPPEGETDGFDAFWAAYPRKIGKQAARKSWSRLCITNELTKRILDAVEYQKTWEQWNREGGRYIPNPATWLNQGRWDDEPPGGSAPSGGGMDGGDIPPFIQAAMRVEEEARKAAGQDDSS